MDALKLKTVRGGMMFAAISFILRPIGIVFSIILARLLSPEDFGLVSLALLLLGAANLITSFGMNAYIVQTHENIDQVAHQSFVIIMLASALLTGITILLAPSLANLLGGGESLIPVLRWMALYILISGLWVIPDSLLLRDLKFKEQGLSHIPGELVSGGLAIPLALMGFGIWSLVIGILTGHMLRAITLWYFERPWVWLRPQKWDMQVVKSMAIFGLPATASSGLRFFQDQIDTWIVGRRLGPVSVGLYSRAFNLSTQIGILLTTSIFGSVLFPSYSKMSDDIPRLSRAYLKSNKMVFLIIVPVSIGLAIIAPILIPVLLGEQWVPMIFAWQLFSLYGLTRPISTNSSPVFLALGKPQRNLAASVVLIAIMIPLILIFIGPLGIAGAALAVSIASFVGMLFNVYQVNQLLPGTARRTLIESIPFLVAGGLMAIGSLLINNSILSLSGGTNLLALILIIMVSAIIYSTIIFILQRDLMLEIYELIIISLKLDQRWPQLLPQSIRSSR